MLLKQVMETDNGCVIEHVENRHGSIILKIVRNVCYFL